MNLAKLPYRIPLLVGVAGLALVAGRPAQAQLIDVSALLNDVVTLTGRVTSHDAALVAIDANLAIDASRLLSIETNLQAQTTINSTLDARTTATAQIANQAAATISVLGQRADGHDAALIAVDARLNAGANATAALGGRIDDHDAALVAVDTRLNAGANATAALGGRVDGHDAALVAVDARLNAGAEATVALGQLVDAQGGAIVAVSTRVDDLTGRVSAHDDAIAANGRAIGTVAAATEVLAGRADGHDAALAAVGLRLDADASALVALDTRVTAHDATLGEHDRRIATLDARSGATAALVNQPDPRGDIRIGAASGGTSVSFAGSDGDRRLSGVAPGVAASDAATMGQLQAGLAGANAYTDRVADRTLATGRAYTDSVVAALDRRMRGEIDAGAATSAAIAGLPQSILPGEGMLGAAVGGRGGEVAMALGVSKAFGGRHAPVLKAGAALDTRRGDLTYNAGVGIHF